MWKNKVEALCRRKQILDAYDLDFLLSLGAGDPATLNLKSLERLAQVIDGFSQKDMKTKLKTVVPEDELNRFVASNFTLLKEKIEQARFEI